MDCFDIFRHPQYSVCMGWQKTWYRLIKRRKLNAFTKRGKVYLVFRNRKNRVSIAESKDGLSFTLCKSKKIRASEKKFLKDTYRLHPRKNYFDNGEIKIEKVVAFPQQDLVIYHSRHSNSDYRVGYAMFGKHEKRKIIWRSETPVWETPNSWQGKKVKYLGLVYFKGKLIAYWQVEKLLIYAVIYPTYKLRDRKAAIRKLRLKKYDQNPIIKPNQENDWEAFNTFNPAAVYEAGKIHLFYRAQSYDYVSRLGYAISSDGFTIEKRFEKPVYVPQVEFELKTPGAKITQEYVSGGGTGGVEDPRATIIDGRLYLVYVAFNGVNHPRLAMTSIAVDDFLNQRWLWEKPVLISPPGVVDKSGCIFPEKVKGKYVILHRIYPDILIDFVDSLFFDGTSWLKGEYKISPRTGTWDSRKIGAGAPPIKTKHGWLLIYQAVDDRDPSEYKVGAMLLDLHNPTKVLHRSKEPILRPSEEYENVGFKAGVIYPCGAVVIDETLFVYYGGADSYVCVAVANLATFLNDLQQFEKPHLEQAKVRRVM